MWVWIQEPIEISIKWFNHNGWIDIFVIKEKYFFCSYFRHISLCFYSNFDQESSLDVEFDSASNEYHTAYFWRTSLPQKQEIPEKTWWWHHHHIFSTISCLWGSEVHKNYAEWVLVGCEIKFRIQWDLPIEIWVKTLGDMSKIWTKMVVFFYDTYPQIYIKKLFKTYTVFQIQRNFIG